MLDDHRMTINTPFVPPQKCDRMEELLANQEMMELMENRDLDMGTCDIYHSTTRQRSW